MDKSQSSIKVNQQKDCGETPEPKQKWEKGNVRYIPSNNNDGFGQHYNPLLTEKAAR